VRANREIGEIGVSVQANLSIDADPQQQAAASPLVSVVRSFLRCIARGTAFGTRRSQACRSRPRRGTCGTTTHGWSDRRTCIGTPHPHI
jgi:hypothetical protein